MNKTILIMFLSLMGCKLKPLKESNDSKGVSKESPIEVVEILEESVEEEVEEPVSELTDDEFCMPSALMCTEEYELIDGHEMIACSWANGGHDWDDNTEEHLNAVAASLSEHLSFEGIDHTSALDFDYGEEIYEDAYNQNYFSLPQGNVIFIDNLNLDFHWDRMVFLKLDTDKTYVGQCQE